MRVHHVIIVLAAFGCSGPSSHAVRPTAPPPGVGEPAGPPAAPEPDVRVAPPPGPPVAAHHPSPAPAPAAGLPREAAELLAAHNRRRAEHCAAPLSWSPALAKVAQGWADHLRAAGCAFEHSGGSYGENLAAGSVGMLSPAGVVDMWYAEAEHYDFARGGFSMQTGHFTQLVWQGTTRVGCGTTTCNDMQTWVCNYDPPGNYQGEFQANVKPKGCR